MAETKNLLLFRKWDLSNIEVVDPGLKTAISLRKQILPYTFGRSALKRFNKSEVNIVERLINKSMHFGKKYAKNTGRMTGKKTKLINTVKTAFEIIELKTGQHPVQVLVKAIEFSAPTEEHLAEQLILASNNDPSSPSVKKKHELERIAQASR